ncbi:glycosyltransferase family 2 protein [Mariniradius sediminis]|uniref:Glycosyltransferase family 2 protein n=1 Tax=Mariniradius sediminis TaxID=2909237 RepID=A0ABS9BQH1_9BACT|nr:glycosyltransferase family A protein [Mariniradius sediminis]MCF1750303.1 glycosyltransferase family 2 protein [Mariniradius sediminis]
MFSIIIPLYNKAQFVQRAIDSVMGQSFREFELIVVNDGSTDGGEQRVLAYGDQVKLITQPNQGVSEARNRGIKEAKYPWIAFLDADDFWLPNYLGTIRQGIAQFPQTGILGCSYSQSIEDLGKVDSQGWFQMDDYFKRAIVNTLFFTSATVIRKSFFLENPGFDKDLSRGEDLDVWFRAVLFFGKPVYNFSKLVYYSQEDAGKATNRAFPIVRSLSYKILRHDYYLPARGIDWGDFEIFRKRYVYFNLFPYLKDAQNDAVAKILLEALKDSNLLLRLVYLPPFGLLRRLMKYPRGRKLLRNYMKFCLRYIY